MGGWVSRCCPFVVAAGRRSREREGERTASCRAGSGSSGGASMPAGGTGAIWRISYHDGATAIDGGSYGRVSVRRRLAGENGRGKGRLTRLDPELGLGFGKFRHFLAMLQVERDLHMIAGDGETSYGRNSRIQEKAMLMALPVLEKAAIQVYSALHPETMVVADLGCSSGPNTLLFVSNLLNAIAAQHQKLGGSDPLELQFFLNDLPGNDFNMLFWSLDQLKKTTTTSDKSPPYYISGLPGSFYTRIFPRQSVHLFHSSCCLHWLPQVPEGLQSEEGAYFNRDNIHITGDAPYIAAKLFQDQFYKDFSLFLKLRHEELVPGGEMVLIFLARKSENIYSGDLSLLLGLFGQSLRTLVAEGLVDREKLDSFVIPMYQPAVGEVTAIVKRSELFELGHTQLLEVSWDPYDNSDSELGKIDSAQSGVNIAKHVRAWMEPMIEYHFGGAIVDVLFTEFASRVGKHFEKEKTKHMGILVSLKKM
ncbi:hypothetical protein PR202_ga17126 [Eleusine coracana subsp. coracana]|uniref:Uncharacterized protein n=1 Tax=Eleusine coracana subsp. coracana TaxID=191504 RepID=A0AAV5CNN1_ELECO|nr:hypothetical protein PR202_ga17126 [Eleusine coracana subsp. coracana]